MSDESSDQFKFSRRGFIRTIAGAAALPVFGGLAFREALGQSAQATLFRVNNCPIHDGQLRHIGLDALLHLLSDNGVKFYKTAYTDDLCGPGGLIAPDDVVLLKVNAQWRCRGATNTDLIRGMIHRILTHPDGFTGEVVIFENGQGRPAAFDGISNSPSNYKFPEITGLVRVNAEQEDLTTIDYLVNTVFAGKPVWKILLDPVRSKFIGATDHTTTGYRKVGTDTATMVSYPCFTTAKGNRIELKEGRWTGSGYAQNVKLIHMPVLKDHGGDVGCTGALKIVYGTLSMKDGCTANRHYVNLGTQCARMWTDVRIPDLNLLDCIWVGYEKNGCSPERGDPAKYPRGGNGSGGDGLLCIQTHPAAAGRKQQKPA